ncbi:hypothetical protein MNJPNG_18235 [Cupriavidus oxalaticus]
MVQPPRCCKRLPSPPAPLPRAGEGSKPAGSLTVEASLPSYFFNIAHFDSATVVNAWSPGMVATTFR